MRVRLRLSKTMATVGEIDLQPSNLRRLAEVDYLGTRYRVKSQFTTFEKGQPLAVLNVVRMEP